MPRWSLLLLLAACAPGKDGDADRDDSDVVGHTDDTDVAGEPGPDGAALRSLQAASAGPVHLDVHDGLPTTVSMDVPLPGDPVGDLVGAQLAFFTTYKALFRLSDPEHELHPHRLRAHGGGVRALQWRQDLGGVTVLDAGLNTLVAGSSLRVTHGRWLPDSASLPVDATPRIPWAAAIDAATEPRDLPGGMPQLRLADPRLTVELSGGPALLWEVPVRRAGGELVQVYVDAHTGEVRFTRALERSDGPTYDYEVRERNGASSSVPDQGTLWFDEDGPTDDYAAGLDGDGDGAEAAQHVRALDDWYFATFGRDGYDADGSELQLHVDLIFRDDEGQPAPNAYGNGGTRLLQFHDGMVTADVVGHEFGHAWEYWESRLTYRNESGALAESVADVFGVLYEHSLGDTDWDLGEGCTLGTLRNLKDPATHGQPDHVDRFVSTDGKGQRDAVSSPSEDNDNGYVHTNSGIPNKAASLLMLGGDHGGVRVRPLGEPTTGALMYWTVSTLITPGEPLEGFADAMVAMATFLDAGPGLLGWDPLQGTACDVDLAYAAVGMRTAPLDPDCDGVIDTVDPDGDGVTGDDDGCPTLPDPSQIDLDDDGLGDPCDPDDDGDDVDDLFDVCPHLADPDQDDADADGHGDACSDDDHDGVLNAVDDCPSLANPDQVDTDHDLQGDACDVNDDGDGWPDVNDLCPLKYDNREDADGDLVGDACDVCPDVADPGQEDCDGDGVGSACETNLELCSEQADRATRGFVSRDALAPLPIGCLSCPGGLGLDWAAELGIPVEITAPAGVDVWVVGPDGAVAARTGGAAHTTLTVRPGMGFAYREPGAAAWTSFEGWGITVAPDVPSAQAVSVTLH